MVRSALQTVFYFYLIYDFYAHGPDVFLLLFAMWFELLWVVVTFIFLKFLADGWKAFEYLAGIVVTIFPVLLLLFLFIYLVTPESFTPSSSLTRYSGIRKAMIGVGINHGISVLFFVWKRGTESNFVANLLIKLISVFFIFLISFILASNLPQPNHLILVGSILLARFLVEWIVNTNAIRKFRGISF